ncbi:MAG: hypothetical protein A2Y17_01415 [Clostridiales bacterium GWF2_38_85]|nr:MAG: hypothetical protein A2Y17_01415 [Clostridiales bacterium GWF2_38_85]
MDITTYKIKTPKLKRKLCIALATDLHNYPYEEIIAAIKDRKPDIIAIPGDIANSYTHGTDNSIGFLYACAKITPSFYSLGNHERRYGGILPEEVDKAGVVLLNNTHIRFEEFHIGGFPTVGNLKWLQEFSELEGFKLLLSHHPEYYNKYIKEKDIDIILSGHAHGGQVRIFGQGLYSPGQGIFPKYTSGVHDNRLVISRGLSNSRKVPRLWNHPEMVFVEIIGIKL